MLNFIKLMSNAIIIFVDNKILLLKQSVFKVQINEILSCRLDFVTENLS